MKININDTARVKLTDHGRAIHRKDYEQFLAESPALARQTVHQYQPPREDADGIWEVQLWVLMQLFGPHVYSGCVMPFENATIEVRP